MIELGDFPPELLEILFDFLETKDLTSISEVNTTFNEIVSNSEKLMKKLTLFIRHPQDISSFADSFKSNRKYRKLSIAIVKTRDCEKFGENQPTGRLFTKLGRTVQELSVDWSNAMRPREASLFEIMNRRRVSARGFIAPEHFDNAIAMQALASVRDDIYNEFVSIVRKFSLLRKMVLKNVHLERARQPNEPLIIYSHLKELKLKQCDAYCFDLLTTCNSLEKLIVSDPWWNSRASGLQEFETFLISQTLLKDLHLKNFQYPRLFQVNPTNNIRFKLRTLILKDCFFADKDIAYNFFRTQNEIQTIHLQLVNEKVRCLDEVFWYNNILKTIISNPHLRTIHITKQRYKLENCEFIANSSNTNVKRLYFQTSEEDQSSELFKTFIRTFPNLKTVEFKAEESDETDSGICFDEGTVLENAESLTITNSSVKSLCNVFAGNLKSFQYVPGKTGEFIDDVLGGFLHRHRGIRHLTIGSRREKSYFFVSFNLCSLIVNFLTQLESITIYNFAEVNKSVKLLTNLRNLKTLTLSSEDYQQFTAKTKVECSRNDLKLINVDIP